MKLTNIIQGWKNYLSKDEQVEKLALERVKNCIGCKHNVKSKVFSWVNDDVKEINASVCDLCSCPLAMKVRSKNEKCDLNLW